MEAFPSLLGESKTAHRHRRQPAFAGEPARGMSLRAALRVRLRRVPHACTPNSSPTVTTRCAATWWRERGSTMPEAILKVEDLTRLFRVGGFRSRGQLHAIDEVSFEVAPGEIVALVGESGSGKSTIARVLAGLYPATSGAYVFEGKSMGRREVRIESRRHADGLPGPLRFDQPGPARRSRPAAIAEAAPPGHQAGRSLRRGGVARREGRTHAGRRGVAALPPRALRRTAPATRLRPGAGVATRR